MRKIFKGLIVFVLVLIIGSIAWLAYADYYLKSKAVKCDTIYNYGTQQQAEELLEKIELDEGRSFAGGDIRPGSLGTTVNVEYCIYKYR